MTIVEALKKHHDEIRDLFKEVKKEPKKYEVLKKHLIVHHENEELFLLNKLKEKSDLRDDSLESIEEHHALDLLLDDLDDFPEDHERWMVKLGILQEFTEHHLEEEEEDLFPNADERFTKDEMNELGEKFTQEKEKQLNAWL